MTKDLLSILVPLAALANELDNRKLIAEADTLDRIVTEASSFNAFPIHKGDKNKKALILSAQEKLLEYGYHMSAGADGAFGKQTEAAVKEFQIQNGLKETGFLTESDHDLLVAGEPELAAKKRVIVAIGDSITANSWQKVPYGNSLEKRVKGSRVFSFGYGGKQTDYISGKLGEALDKQPDDIIILAGVNDIASGKSVEHITGNLQDMYRRSKEVGARVIAVKILPWHARKWSKGKEHITEAVNNWIANSPDVDVVIEGSQMHSDDPSKYEMNKAYTNDGIHPNDEGKDMLAKIIADKAFAEKEDEEKSDKTEASAGGLGPQVKLNDAGHIAPSGYVMAREGKLTNIPGITSPEIQQLYEEARYYLALAAKQKLPYNSYWEFEVSGKQYAAQVVKHYRYGGSGRDDPGGHKSISIFYKP